MSQQKQKTIGGFEQINLPALGGVVIMAKVDTGAYYGAVHVDEIVVDKSGLVTVTLNDENYTFSPETIKRTRVRSSSSHDSRRVVVKMPIVIGGEEITTWIGLTSRKSMKFPALIGRYLLRENNFLVDVNLNSEYDTDGRKIS